MTTKPKLDIEPANTPEFLGRFINYLEKKKALARDDQKEYDRLSEMVILAMTEQVAAMTIRNLWLDIKLDKMT